MVVTQKLAGYDYLNTLNAHSRYRHLNGLDPFPLPHHQADLGPLSPKPIIGYSWDPPINTLVTAQVNKVKYEHRSWQ